MRVLGCTLLLLALSAMPAGATLILVYVRPNEVWLASDAAVVHLDGRPLPETQCKTPLLESGLFFALSGLSEYDKPAFRATTLAQRVSAAERTPERAARRYAREAAGALRAVWRVERRLVPGSSEGKRQDSGSSVHHFLFAGLDGRGRLSVAGGEIVLHPAHDEVTVGLLPVLAVTGATQGRFLALGVASPEAAEVEKRVGRDGPARALEVTLREEIGRLPGQLGLPIAMVRVEAGGRFTWVRGGACAEDETTGVLR